MARVKDGDERGADGERRDEVAAEFLCQKRKSVSSCDSSSGRRERREGGRRTLSRILFDSPSRGTRPVCIGLCKFGKYGKSQAMRNGREERAGGKENGKGKGRTLIHAVLLAVRAVLNLCGVSAVCEMN
jgi:hypothetical protein